MIKCPNCKGEEINTISNVNSNTTAIEFCYHYICKNCGFQWGDF